MASESDFRAAMAFTLAAEGGWYAGDRPSDPNPTMQGVTQKVYDAYSLEKGLQLRSVRYMLETEREEIYRDIWVDAHGPDLPGVVAGVHFDAAFNMGTGQAALLLQRALRVTVDGLIGPKTIAEAIGAPQRETVTALIGQRLKFYTTLIQRRPTLKPNMAGWQARCVRLTRWAEHHLAGDGGLSGGEVGDA